MRERLGVATGDADLRFYGGAPGLDVEDPVLPRLGLPDIPMPGISSVVLHSLLREAYGAAGRWYGSGDVYEVAPLGDAVSVLDRSRTLFRAATVLRVLDRGVACHDYPTGPVFFHGGVPGLNPGDRILPPTWTQRGSGAAMKAWMTPLLSVAWGYAFDRGGTVYQVRPEGLARPEAPSADSPVTAEAAVVVAVIARDVDRPVPETTDPRHPSLREAEDAVA